LGDGAGRIAAMCARRPATRELLETRRVDAEAGESRAMGEEM
jgi:hypothetical protein